MSSDSPILQEIRQGFRLRPTKTIDRSAPVIMADGERLKKMSPSPVVAEPEPPMPPAPPPLPQVTLSPSGPPGPPGPPPPPQLTQKRVQPTRSAPNLPKLGGGGSTGSRDALLASIRGGIRLKKTVVHDKSAPIIAAEIEEQDGRQATPPIRLSPNNAHQQQQLPVANGTTTNGLMSELQSSAQFGRFQEAAETNVPSFMTHLKDERAVQNEMKREPLVMANTAEERKPNNVMVQSPLAAVSAPERNKPAYTQQPSIDLVRQIIPAQPQQHSTTQDRQKTVAPSSTLESASVMRAIEEQRRDEEASAASFNPYRIQTFQPQLDAPRNKERIIETKVLPKPQQHERIIETKVIPKQPEIVAQKLPSPPQLQKQSPQPQFVQQKQTFSPPAQPKTVLQQQSASPQLQRAAQSQPPRAEQKKAEEPVILPNVNRLRQSFDQAISQKPVIPKMVGHLPPPKPLPTQSVFVRNGHLRASSPPKAAFVSSHKPSSPQKFEVSVALEPDVRESRSFEAERLPTIPVSPNRQKSVEFVLRAAPGKLRESIDNPPPQSTANNNSAATQMAANRSNSAERHWKSVVANRGDGHASDHQQDRRNVVYDQNEGLLPQVNRLRSAFESNESDSDNSSEISEQRYGQTIILPVSPRQSGNVPVTVATRTVKNMNGGGVPTSTPWVITKDKVANNADKHQVSRLVQQEQEKKLSQQQRNFGRGNEQFTPSVGRAHKVVIGSQSHNMVNSPFETMPVEYMRTNYKFNIDLSDNDSPIQILQR